MCRHALCRFVLTTALILYFAFFFAPGWTECLSAQESPRGELDVGLRTPQLDGFAATDSLADRAFVDSPGACDDCGVPSLIHDNDRSWCDSKRYWGTAEFLYWHSRGVEYPPLITTSEQGTSRADAGILGRSSTTTLLGDDRLSEDWQAGGRFSLGFWFDPNRDIGIEFTYTMLGEQSDAFSAASDQFAILARPFFNVDANTQDARIFSFPNEISGAIAVSTTTDYDVYELLIRRPLSQGSVAPTFVIYGYRTAELDDSLEILDSSTSLSGATLGARVQSLDSFRSRNVFHGVEFGLLTSHMIGSCCYIDITGKVAFGETDHTIFISGQSTTANSQGNVSTNEGGLLAQPSNIGVFESNSHGVLHDVTLRFRRNYGPGVVASVGYGLHHWASVKRAGDQVDSFINPTQIPPGTLVGAARPAPPNATRSFVAQGVTVSLEYRW